MDSKLSMEHMIEQGTRFCKGVPQQDNAKVCIIIVSLNIVKYHLNFIIVQLMNIQ